MRSYRGVLPAIPSYTRYCHTSACHCYHTPPSLSHPVYDTDGFQATMSNDHLLYHPVGQRQGITLGDKWSARTLNARSRTTRALHDATATACSHPNRRLTTPHFSSSIFFCRFFVIFSVVFSVVFFIEFFVASLSEHVGPKGAIVRAPETRVPQTLPRRRTRPPTASPACQLFPPGLRAIPAPIPPSPARPPSSRAASPGRHRWKRLQQEIQRP